ncbi:ribonuclease Z [Flavobacterium psychrophilum]|jgi:ribonuclease Z|uniref:Ribonuclease Z n=2 Tax=Flavobacterium psychrophilum TaxID=96345 RepID=A6H099_FLAPJ|nr:ribonuclease Z [Flavobacterium psychrophilum]AIG30461.1 ribonuclease Z [Flavobacterium psychrophilum]AIG32736.1 ribonuclease Z [Flavobacterium psychrophilum]AIG34891.1 ribonuclease Z [Flavobacterium psychrophilum]AIG37256.1 ribonuclease Z [Flavobacterium psychrophilum]AIG39520.1 ribonuclease Z [Flavobacterium psychrophilum]
MNLTILGCYAATPRTFTNPTSQVLEIRNRLFLIDCGEGTQVQLRKNKIKFSAINHIFISHLHGDHFYGLIGLISTFNLLNRNNNLTVYGPKGIQEIIKLQLKLSNSWPQYELHFVELTSTKSEIIFEDDKVIVKTIPLKHRVYTNGFLFQEKIKERKLNANAVQNYKIETCYFQNIKNGKDITLEDGRIIPNSELTFDPETPKSYAFCSDTIYNESIIPVIKNVDVLYHETTFLESEAELAKKTMHSTAKEAARIALQANCKQLILGHYSTRYESIKLFKEEAQTIFLNTLLGDDGKFFKL